MPTSDKTASSLPLRYEPQFEHAEDGEKETIAELIATFEKIQRTVQEDTGHAERAVHAKSHGILRGELQVLGGLAPSLAQGLFARPGTYPVVMRFSTIPADILDDNVSTPRGLAIKVVGVPGERLPGSEGTVTQDFVLVNGPAFGKSSAKGFLGSLKQLAATTDKAPGAKRVLSAVTRTAERVVEAFGGKSSTLLSLGGHPETHLLGDTYYSQTPLLYGEYIAKVALAPASPELLELTNAPLDMSGKPNALREAVIAFFGSRGAQWELQAQLCVDVDAMPIEDSSKIWPEDKSPYVTIARLTAPPQNPWSPERIREVEESMSFSPWHGIAAHRPLGSINRVRQAAYQEAARFRASGNRRPISEPSNLDHVPR